VLNVDRFGDEVPVPAFGPRMVCTCCGIICAHARPNWQERLTENSALTEVDDTSILRTELSTPLSLPSQPANSLSALAPAKRAGAQRLCALAQPRCARLPTGTAAIGDGTDLAINVRDQT
jgi:hypothetical protein